MEKKLQEAAVKGCVPSLLSLIHEDALVLDRYMAGCFTETPLHIASMLGHLEFTKEIISLKPQLAQEYDFQRRTPLHLATANGHFQVVKALLSVNPHVCVVPDKNGRNPLHVAVIKGQIDVLQELVRANPEAVRLPGKGGENVFHLCVKHYQLEALKFLMERINNYNDDFVSLKDDNGITALQLAVACKQTESINLLIKKVKIDISLDIVSPKNEDNSLEHGVATSDVSATFNNISSSTKQPRRRYRKFNRRQKTWLEQKRNALMVVASLIATMAFQAGINPPGGVWQDNDLQEPTSEFHRAGRAILADTNPRLYTAFVIYNTTSLLASVSVILLLISGLPFWGRFFMWVLMGIMWTAITSTLVTFSVSFFSLSSPHHRTNRHVQIATCLVVYGLLGILLVGHSARLIFKIVKFARGILRKGGCSSLSGI